MIELKLDKVARVDRAWLELDREQADKPFEYASRPPQGGKWRYYRIVFDGTCDGCAKHSRPTRHLEQRKMSFPTRTDADRFVAQVNADAQRGQVVVEAPAPEQPSVETVGEWLAEWRDKWTGNITPRTLESYVQAVDGHLIPKLGHIPLAELDDTAVNEFIAGQVAKGYKPSTVHKHHVVLAIALNKAVKRKRLAHNPADTKSNDITLPSLADPGAKREHHVLTDDQTDALLHLIHGHVLEVPAALALLAGLRAQEALALRWRDVDFDRHLIHVNQALEQTRAADGSPVLRIKAPKSKSGKRAVPMDDVLEAVLMDWRKTLVARDLAESGTSARWTAPDALVIADDMDRNPLAPMSRNRLSTRWHQWRVDDDIAAVIGDVTFHDLRHSAASYWLRHGVPLFRVSRWLGHANIAITANVYGHENPDESDAEFLSGLRSRTRAEREQVIDIKSKTAGE